MSPNLKFCYKDDLNSNQQKYLYRGVLDNLFKSRYHPHSILTCQGASTIIYK